MPKEKREIRFDTDLQVEAYRFEGIKQAFPNHFHLHYMIGFLEAGERRVTCKNNTCTAGPGSLFLFHPGENHACSPSGTKTMDFSGLNIPEKTMASLAEEITGKMELPGFSKNRIQDRELTANLQALHRIIMDGAPEFEKEERLLFLISSLMEQYGLPFSTILPECREEIAKACTFINENYMHSLSLDQISQYAGLSKSTLLRAFTKSHGITPYRYLESVRINKAKKLLEKGVMPVDAALQTGFSDQSHFTNYFSLFTGIAPGVYRALFL